ncbi:MAG: hypothetical protein IPP90_23260 [Gemmatimonadaceae bacterium]|nr:hypothetical protein [Gemmatimonadaceae bacterium]
MLLPAVVALFVGQPCPPTSPGRPYFDFQVSTPAVYLGTDSTRVRPDESRHARRPYPADFALAQFVVDTIGVPVPGTLKLLMQPAGLSAESVMMAIIAWRYRPARVGACKVPQLVQAPLRWK